MIRHITFMLLLIVAAIGSGVALVPGELERWTMLVRDGRNDEALKVLETRYQEGNRDLASVMELYKLLMLNAEMPRATQVMEHLAASRPNDVETLMLLAKHYSDTQDTDSQERTLEQVFELNPSPKVAENLLSDYRLEGAFDKEEKLLQSMMNRKMIASADAERLGMLQLAEGNLDSARDALAYFDTLAPPEQMSGRFALFDVLVRSGDRQAAFSKAESWIQNLRDTNMQLAGDPNGPAVQLVEWMRATDPVAAHHDLCSLTQLAAYEQLLNAGCAAPEQEIRTADLRIEKASHAITRMPGRDLAVQNRAKRIQPQPATDVASQIPGHQR